MEFMLLLFWILLTFLVVSFSAIIAKKKGSIYIISIFGGLVVISNVLANKIIIFWHWAVPAGIIIYSSTFLLTDILNEFYGKKKARQAVFGGLFASIVLVLAISIAIKWPAAGYWQGQEAFEIVLGNTWRIVLGSLVAYFVSQNHDVFMFDFLKRKTNGKHLWLRNNVSTILSQVIDTLIFVAIAFYGVFPLVEMIIGQLIVKIFLALLDTPFIYFVRAYYRR